MTTHPRTAEEQWAIDKSLGRLDDGFEELLAGDVKKRRQEVVCRNCVHFDPGYELNPTCNFPGKNRLGEAIIGGATRPDILPAWCGGAFQRKGDPVAVEAPKMCHYCSERRGEDLVFSNSICKPCGDKVRQYLALIEIDNFTRTENESRAVKKDFIRQFLHKGDVFCLEEGASVQCKDSIKKLKSDIWYVTVSSGWEKEFWRVVASPLVHHEYDSRVDTISFFQTPGSQVSQGFLAKKRRIDIWG